VQVTLKPVSDPHLRDSVPAPESTPPFVRYRDDLEQRHPDEDELVKEITDSLHANNVWAYHKYHHGIRDAHAKSHGILRGELTVYPDLPEHLRQGLFATPGSYPVIARLSSTFGAIRSDQIRGVRGLGIKVLGVEGPRALADDDATTQDFILVTHREFPFPDVRAYLTQGMPAAWLLARAPEAPLHVVLNLVGGLQTLLTRVGLSLPMTLAVFSAPNTHPLGLTFYSSAPIRYGDYVAKFCVAPLSPSVTALEHRPVLRAAGRDAFAAMVAEFFATNTAEYELRVQLCTDLATMPIEDVSVAWPESASPHIGVAKITYPPQNPASPARTRFGDDVLSFNSWRGLAAHRPLGSINRLKKLVYDASSDYRHRVNNVARMEPTDVTQLPD
jgi:hypothetical protein